MSLRIFKVPSIKHNLFRNLFVKSHYSLTNELMKLKILSLSKINSKLYFTKKELNVHCVSKFCSIEKYNNKINFEQICNETLEALCDYFEHVIEESPHLNNPDITYSDGVLTVHFGEPHGTYVINRQMPNKQIWLSSPKSGPKRYNFNGTKWIYKHDGICLHELLNNEISKIVSIKINFFDCVNRKDK
ncbi:frataxin homolog, mitochondrial [Daktulosphaira vitifoliae]|uniref:frataxin homolog, mitochondrial n=1 Tax=Daktulosphaira vitifoliae TaxID=58002 RepID=UPI0021AA857F|nr:frataxin homolog, mitochondrial [Daktulosphaira vitifoliae]